MTGRARTALIGIVVLAAALRFPTLGEQSFWADEAATADVLRHGFGDLLAAVRDQESTPPLYYVLAKAWTLVLGDGEAATRSLSALFGTATVPVAGLVAARVGDSERAGLFAALLVATNPLLIWFSQEARAYALLVLLAALSLLLLLRALDDPAPRRLLAWGVVVALALATHFFALFLVAGEALWLLLALRGDVRRRALALVAPAAVGLALLPLALDQREAGRAGFIGEESLGHRVLQVLKQFLVGYDAPGEVVLTTVSAAVVVAALVGLWRWGTAGRGAVTRNLGLVVAVSVAVPLALAAVGEDYVITRNLLATLVPVLVFVAVGLVALPGRVGTAGLATLALVGAGTGIAVQADARYQREDWRSAVRRLGPVPPGGRTIVVVPGSGRIAVQYYLPRARVKAADEGTRVDEAVVLEAGAGPDGQVLVTVDPLIVPDPQDAVILLERP